MYCKKVKNTAFLLFWKHVILFFVLELHFSAKIGNEMSAKLRSWQLIFINCPAYLVLEKKPLSIVQLVIMIWEISPSGQNTKSSLLPMMHESFINKFPHMRIVASAFLLSCLLLHQLAYSYSSCQLCGIDILKADATRISSAVVYNWCVYDATCTCTCSCWTTI